MANLECFPASKLPSCASKCQTLTSANSACVPPTAPQTDQGTYQSCFCSSTALTTLYSTPSGICDSTCSSTDMSTIQQWYIQLCTGGVVETPGSGSGTASQTSSSTTAPSSTTTNVLQTGTSNASNSGSSSSNANRSWYDPPFLSQLYHYLVHVSKPNGKKEAQQLCFIVSCRGQPVHASIYPQRQFLPCSIFNFCQWDHVPHAWTQCPH